jgi:hypothetical protein
MSGIKNIKGNYRPELKRANMENEFTKIEELLESEAKKINPPPENLKFILERLPQVVTKHDIIRNTSLRASKGRVLETVIHDLNFFMANIWKVALSVTAIAVVIIAVGFWRMNTGQRGNNDNMAVTPQNETQSIEFASSEVNSAIDELADDVGDAAVIEAEVEDDSSADSDSQPLDNFDTITNYYE